MARQVLHTVLMIRRRQETSQLQHLLPRGLTACPLKGGALATQAYPHCILHARRLSHETKTVVHSTFRFLADYIVAVNEPQLVHKPHNLLVHKPHNLLP